MEMCSCLVGEKLSISRCWEHSWWLMPEGSLAPVNLNTCICFSRIFTKYFKGLRRQRKGKEISESGASVPEDTHKKPQSPRYNRNKTVWSLALTLLLLYAVKLYPPKHFHCNYSDTVEANKHEQINRQNHLLVQPATHLMPPGTSNL